MKKISLFSTKAKNQRKIVTEIPEGVRAINAPDVWGEANYGQGVVVAVLDTGCQLEHPNLTKNIIGGKNFTSDNNRDPDDFSDNNGHGTHVAGIIAASLNGKGVAGVAPEASLLILKVMNASGTGNYQALIDAINYSINWRGTNGEKVRIITMSLGGKEEDKPLHAAIKQAVKEGILIVCAAGNYGDGDQQTSEIVYPGFYNEVVQVGAVNSKKHPTYFSNTNQEIDIVAPGENILSTFWNSQYIELSGTSMAAPHIAGAAALLINIGEKDFGRRLTEGEIYAYLIKKTHSLGFSKKVEGWGFLKLLDVC